MIRPKSSSLAESLCHRFLECSLWVSNINASYEYHFWVSVHTHEFGEFGSGEYIHPKWTSFQEWFLEVWEALLWTMEVLRLGINVKYGKKTEVWRYDEETILRGLWDKGNERGEVLWCPSCPKDFGAGKDNIYWVPLKQRPCKALGMWNQWDTKNFDRQT